MSQEFQREARYAVFKFSKLSGPQSKILQEAMCKLPRVAECLVIESDWPEYEPVWAMIEARMNGAPPVPPAGEVEVLVVVDARGILSRNGVLRSVELVDRAHVTRLTAENARLQARIDELDKGFWGRVAGTAVGKRLAVEAELTKALELLSDVQVFNGEVNLAGAWFDRRDDLLTHQSAPAAKGDAK